MCYGSDHKQILQRDAVLFQVGYWLVVGGSQTLVVGHRLEIIIDHRLESVAAVHAIF